MHDDVSAGPAGALPGPPFVHNPPAPRRGGPLYYGTALRAASNAGRRRASLLQSATAGTTMYHQRAALPTAAGSDPIRWGMPCLARPRSPRPPRRVPFPQPAPPPPPPGAELHPCRAAQAHGFTCSDYSCSRHASAPHSRALLQGRKAQFLASSPAAQQRPLVQCQWLRVHASRRILYHRTMLSALSPSRAASFLCCTSVPIVMSDSPLERCSLSAAGRRGVAAGSVMPVGWRLAPCGRRWAQSLKRRYRQAA